jgi:glycosyltransferase involved in cell wall biosynthesis
MATPPLALIVPVHNAADAVTASLPGWVAVLGAGSELIVVDDGSTDGTADAAAKLAARFPLVRVLRHETRRGIGACLRTALDATTLPLVATVTLDYPYTPGDLPGLAAEIGRTEDVYGTPFEVSLVSGCRTGRPTPAVWGFLGKAYRLLARVLVGYPPSASPGWLGVTNHRRAWRAWVFFGSPLHDPDCSLKVVRRSVLEKFPIQSDGGFAFTEIVAKAVFTTYLMDELPLTPSPAAVPVADWRDFGTVLRDPHFTPTGPVPAPA